MVDGNFTASVAENANKTPYQILGVGAAATQDEIKNAYRKLAKKFHPDLNPGNKEAEKQFKDISAAYERVGTAEERAKFDRGETERSQFGGGQAGGARRPGPFYHQAQQAGGRYAQGFEGMDDDFLSSIFGQGARGSRGGRSFDRGGEDALYQMEVAFKDAILGAEREISLPNGKKLRVKIPAGVESGTKLRFSGQGSKGMGQGAPGDAYVELSVRPSPLFKRVGSDLEIELPVSIAEAILGGEIKTPTIDGSILLKIPAHVSSGQRIRVPGKGVPSLKSGGTRGDQYVVLKIVTPKAPSVEDAEFKQAVEAWSLRHPFDPRAGLGVERGGE